MATIRIGAHYDASEPIRGDAGTVQLARIAAARIEREQRQRERDLLYFRLLVIGTVGVLGLTIFGIAEYGVAAMCDAMLRAGVLG